jgi:hypothetical protein
LAVVWFLYDIIQLRISSTVLIHFFQSAFNHYPPKVKMSSPDVSIQYDRQSHAKAHGNASQQFHPLNAGATEALGSLADSGASPHSVDTNDDNESAAGHSDATSVASDLENLSPNTSFSADNEAEPHKDQSRASERDIPDDPFESERTRILFDAVDKIRSLCQKELNIPQVCR